MTGNRSDVLFSAQLGVVRARLLVVDVAVLVWCVLWWRVAAALRDGVAALADPGRQAVAAGERFSGTLGGAGSAAERMPLVGDRLATPLRGAAGAGVDLAAAGRAYQAEIASVARGVFWVVLIIAAGLVLACYLWWRLGRVPTLQAARRLRESPDGLALLGLRAAVSLPLPRLVRLTAAAPRPGERTLLDDELLQRWGAAELARLGLRAPAPNVHRPAQSRRHR